MLVWRSKERAPKPGRIGNSEKSCSGLKKSCHHLEKSGKMLEKKFNGMPLPQGPQRRHQDDTRLGLHLAII